MGVRVLFVVKEIEGAEPIGALYVAGCLEQAGHVCRFVGTRGNEVLEEVARFEPDVVAFGATTGLHRYYLGLAAAIKARFPKVITRARSVASRTSTSSSPSSPRSPRFDRSSRRVSSICRRTTSSTPCFALGTTCAT